jgi:hypothetical protein
MNAGISSFIGWLIMLPCEQQRLHHFTRILARLVQASTVEEASPNNICKLDVITRFIPVVIVPHRCLLHCNETHGLLWYLLGNSTRVCTVKRPDFIVQGVHDERLWFYRTGCIQWSTLILSYRVCKMRRSDFIIRGVYNETSWLYRTGFLQLNALILKYRVYTMKLPDITIQGV